MGTNAAQQRHRLLAVDELMQAAVAARQLDVVVVLQQPQAIHGLVSLVGQLQVTAKHQKIGQKAVQVGRPIRFAHLPKAVTCAFQRLHARIDVDAERGEARRRSSPRQSADAVLHQQRKRQLGAKLGAQRRQPKTEHDALGKAGVLQTPVQQGPRFTTKQLPAWGRALRRPLRGP